MTALAADLDRQIALEDWQPGHDDKHCSVDLTAAAPAFVYIATGQSAGQKAVLDLVPQWWPWDKSRCKPSSDPSHNLVKAGALIAAEIWPPATSGIRHLAHVEEGHKQHFKSCTIRRPSSKDGAMRDFLFESQR